jgi:hypothetical protein
VLSRGALRLLMQDPQTMDTCITQYQGCWGGDIRMSLCLRDVGVMLTPIVGFSTSPPTQGYAWPEDPCARPYSFHHLFPSQILQLWGIESKVAREVGSGTRGLTTGDVYASWRPSLGRDIPQPDMDRPGGVDYQAKEAATPEHCMKMCKRDRLCRSYSHGKGMCWMKRAIASPKPMPGFSSGVIKHHYVCDSDALAAAAAQRAISAAMSKLDNFTLSGPWNNSFS